MTIEQIEQEKELEQTGNKFDDIIKQENVLNRPRLNSASIIGGKAIFGSGNNILKFDDSNGLWLGNTDYSSAPFKVSMAGVLTATGANISGTITITGGSGISNLSDVGALALEDDLDGVPDGTTYGKVANTNISSGNIVLQVDQDLSSQGIKIITASSGARVELYPDSNTGIRIIDDSGNDVFKAFVGGTDVGDVQIGDYTGGQGILYDKSAGKIKYKNIEWSEVVDDDGNKPADNATVGATFSVNISGGGSGDGQVSNNGYVSNLSIGKLTAGNLNVEMNLTTGGTIKSNNYVTGTSGWKIDNDGSAEFQNAIIRGSLNANDITAGILTGRTVRTASSGARIQLDNTNYLQAYDTNYLRLKIDISTLYFYDSDGTERGRIYGDNTSSSFYFEADTIYMYNHSDGVTFSLNMPVNGMISWLAAANSYNLFWDTSIGGWLFDSSDGSAVLAPNDNNAYNIGTSSKQWKNIYIDGIAYLDAISNVDYIDFLGKSTPPGSPTTGTVYYDNSIDKLKVYNGSNWETISSS